MPPETFIGKHVAEFLGWEGFEQTAKAYFDRCFAGEVVNYAAWFNQSIGQRYLAVTYSPLRPTSERVESVLVISRDLTEHVLASEALRKAQLELARAYRLDPWQRLRKVILPAALPSILTGVQVALILTWLATVGVEYFMSAGPSIGGILLNGAESFHLDLVFVGILVLGGVGFALNQAAHALGAHLLRHRPQTLKA